MNAPMKLRLQHVTAYPNRDGSFRYYFRRRGQPMARLPDDPLSPEFMEAYQRNLDWVAPAVHAAEGTFAWLCDQYMDSAEFKGKAKTTREARRRVILSMTKERINPRYPETFAIERAHKIGPRHISALRDRKAESPNAANERLKILSQVFKLAIARGWRADNPVKVVERLSVPRGGHDTATDDDITAYLARHTSGPAWLAMTILRHTGVRVSDLRILGRQHIRQGHLVFETVKTGVRCELSIHPELMAALPRDQMTFLTNEWGRPFASDKALSQRVAKWFRQAGVEKMTAHSVRKWRATKIAENGASEMQLMALFGWRDAKEARPYVQAANRRKMADEASEKFGNV
ncbi:tyrosine-type recombinase/integrase [Chelativorans xinjiangense]|uniref:tyrosine-type recombinase/integrase n=1 Tax=Chelativorans xinjiangense TaxID=2681485 RepID=UPI00135B0A0F|nr:site-specific integrase [Chelativorans xinjiangense]